MEYRADPNLIARFMKEWSPTDTPVQKPDRIPFHLRLWQSGPVLEVSWKPNLRGPLPRNGASSVVFMIVWGILCIGVFSAPTCQTGLAYYIGLVLLSLLGGFGAINLLNVLFQSESLRLAPDGVKYERCVLIRLHRQFGRIDRWTRITGFAEPVKAHRGNRIVRFAHGIKMLTPGDPICVGRDLPLDFLMWLADTLARHLQPLLPEQQGVTQTSR